MKTLILVAVILQLLISINEINGDYEFGDIVAFPRKCPFKNKPMYKHYAVYVGNKTVWTDIGQEDNDIFHRTSSLSKTGCKFAKLRETTGKPPNDKKDNYFDGFKGITPGSRESIIQRIEEVKANCGRYKLLSNNCEHLATYVRYGVRLSLQNGTVAKFLFRPDLDSPEIRAVVEKLQNNQEEAAKCQSAQNDVSNQGSYLPILWACLALLPIFHFMTPSTI